MYTFRYNDYCYYYHYYYTLLLLSLLVCLLLLLSLVICVVGDPRGPGEAGPREGAAGETMSICLSVCPYIYIYIYIYTYIEREREREIHIQTDYAQSPD